MELVNIENLLEKYFEATTTVQEEQALQLYFSQDNVAPHLQEYQPMFQHFANLQGEQYTKNVPLQPRKNYLKWGSVAASIIFALGFFTVNSIQINKEQEEALLAYYQTKEALNLISNQFNTGTSKINYLKTFETSKQQIFKSNH